MEEWPTGSAILSINGVARDNGAVVPYLGVFFHLPSESHLGELLNTQIFSLHLGLSQNLLWVYPKVLNHKSSSSDFDESWGLRTTARSPFMQVVTNANVKELKMVTRLYKKMVSKRGSWMTFQSSRECFRIDSSYGKKKKAGGDCIPGPIIKPSFHHRRKGQHSDQSRQSRTKSQEWRKSLRGN